VALVSLLLFLMEPAGRWYLILATVVGEARPSGQGRA
jgi:hypothetical protein